MSHTKNQKIKQKQDAYEQDIEDNLDINKSLPSKKKTQVLAKLKAAAKEHVQKRNKENHN
jgi:hypothetical protein